MKVLAIDTETHALKDPQAVEVAWLELDAPSGNRQRFASLYKPSEPITFGAMAAHHLTCLLYTSPSPRDLASDLV